MNAACHSGVDISIGVGLCVPLSSDLQGRHPSIVSTVNLNASCVPLLLILGEVFGEAELA